jgi:hypothetical protein
MIIPYSKIKIIENKPPKYSILKPDTISDSPSEKSNGERFDSDSLRNIHIKNAIGKKIDLLIPFSQKRNRLNVIVENKYTNHKIKIIMQTS